MNKYAIELIGGFEQVNPLNDNADLYVRFQDGSNYVVTVYTPLNILTILDRYKQSGECLSGKYYYDTNMLLVSSIDIVTVGNVIDDLIKQEEFQLVFKRI